jgi:hypothetical protein
MMTVRSSCLLNTALPMPLVRPLCQKPPSPMIGHRALAAVGAERRRARCSQSIAHDAVAHVERRQCRKRMAADVRADVQRPRLPSAESSLPRRTDAPGIRCTSPRAAEEPRQARRGDERSFTIAAAETYRRGSRRPPVATRASEPRPLTATRSSHDARNCGAHLIDELSRSLCAAHRRCIHPTSATHALAYDARASHRAGAGSGSRPARCTRAAPPRRSAPRACRRRTSPTLQGSADK